MRSERQNAARSSRLAARPRRSNGSPLEGPTARSGCTPRDRRCRRTVHPIRPACTVLQDPSAPARTLGPSSGTPALHRYRDPTRASGSLFLAAPVEASPSPSTRWPGRRPQGCESQRQANRVSSPHAVRMSDPSRRVEVRRRPLRGGSPRRARPRALGRHPSQSAPRKRAKMMAPAPTRTSSARAPSAMWASVIQKLAMKSTAAVPPKITRPSRASSKAVITMPNRASALAPMADSGDRMKLSRSTPVGPPPSPDESATGHASAFPATTDHGGRCQGSMHARG